MNRVLRLPEALQREVGAWAAAAYPYESCGLLVGRRGDGETQVMSVRRARNIQVMRVRDRYVIDPVDFNAAKNEANARGLELVGTWHTHLDDSARPSASDRQLAWSAWSYLILGVAAGRVTEIRSWHLGEGGEFEEEPIAPAPAELSG